MEQKLVLIVDDDTDNREVIRTVVEALAGARTEEAGSGAEALELVRRVPPDLILLDSYLPDVSGCDVAVRLKADPATRWIPIVAVSAHCADMDCPDGTVGCDACIAKPFDIDHLASTVRRYLGTGGGQAG